VLAYLLKQAALDLDDLSMAGGDDYEDDARVNASSTVLNYIHAIQLEVRRLSVLHILAVGDR
jgi:hypothetical protein